MGPSPLKITVLPGRLDAELGGVVVSVPHDAPDRAEAERAVIRGAVRDLIRDAIREERQK